MVIPPATEKRPERQFGFVHFTEQAAADKAVAEAAGADKPELLGKALEVQNVCTRSSDLIHSCWLKQYDCVCCPEARSIGNCTSTSSSDAHVVCTLED